MSRLSAAESLKLALDYIAQFPTRYIFPLAPGTKGEPLIKDNLKRASNSTRQIEVWAKRFPGCNWGLSPKLSNVVPVDIDTKEGKVGQATFDMLEMLYDTFPETEEVITPSGGKHLYYNGEHVFALGKAGFGEDIDCPQYTLIPGCRTADGEYRLISSVDTADAPAWFYDFPLLGKAKERRGPKIADIGETAVKELDTPAMVAWAIDFLQNDAEIAIAWKNGNTQTWKIAAQLRGQAISQAKANELMLEYYNPRCEPEWDAEELEKIIGNAYSYSTQEVIGEKTAEAEFTNDEVDVKSIPTMGDPKAIAAEQTERTQLKARVEREKSAPVDQRQDRPGVVRVLDDWVYVAGLDRFVKVNNVSVVEGNKIWSRLSFDSYFKYLTPKGKLSDELLKRKDAKAIRRFEAVGYVPGEGISVEGGRVCNLYRAPDITPTPGDTTFWDEHLAFLFPNEVERAHLINWLAWLYQNPKRKPKHALLIQGHLQGTGKSFIVDMMRAILGNSNVTTVSQNDLGSQFNGYAMRTKLIAIEELRAVDRAHVKSALHDIITQDSISINEKNMPKFDMENCFGIIAMTNDDAAISLDMSDRRYLVLRTEATPRSTEYYSELYGKLKDRAAVEAVAFALQNWDIGAYSGAGRAPRTTAKDQMIRAGLGELETWLLENANQYPLNGRVVTVSDVVAILPPRLERMGAVTRLVGTALRQHFQAKDAGQRVVEDGSRPRLLVINGCGILNMDGWEQRVAKIYDLDRKNAAEGKPLDDLDAARKELTDDEE